MRQFRSTMGARVGGRLGWATAVSAIVATLGFAPIQAEQRFLSVLDEVPLMGGLVEDAGAAISFDAPSGRIVEAYAESALAPAEIAAFYARSLPALGWRQVAAGDAGEFVDWVRAGERLRLEFARGEAPMGVRFFLAPD